MYIKSIIKSSKKEIFTINYSYGYQKLWHLSERYKLIRERENGGLRV